MLNKHLNTEIGTLECKDHNRRGTLRMFAYLPEPPVEDALVEDAGLGGGPHSPHKLVSLHVATGGAAGHAGLVRAAWRYYYHCESCKRLIGKVV